MTPIEAILIWTIGGTAIGIGARYLEYRQRTRRARARIRIEARRRARGIQA